VETAVKQWSKEQNTDFHGQAMKMWDLRFSWQWKDVNDVVLGCDAEDGNNMFLQNVSIYLQV
jgi:hypothetical protein